jgi:hypothetical protein
LCALSPLCYVSDKDLEQTCACLSFAYGMFMFSHKQLSRSLLLTTLPSLAILLIREDDHETLLRDVYGYIEGDLLLLLSLLILEATGSRCLVISMG